MHSPMDTHEETMRVWRKFEEFYDKKEVDQLGVSNCYDPEEFIRIYNVLLFTTFSTKIIRNVYIL